MIFKKNITNINNEASSLFDNLMNKFLEIDSKNEMEDFLRGILTDKELTEVPNRLEIIKLLKKEVAQHEIANRLGVGIATVTRGSKELKKGRFKYV